MIVVIPNLQMYLLNPSFLALGSVTVYLEINREFHLFDRNVHNKVIQSTIPMETPCTADSDCEV